MAKVREKHNGGLAPFWDKPGVLEIVLACVSLLAFVGTLAFDFVYDDREQILQNPFITAWKYLPHDFTSDSWAQSAGHQIKYYRPAVVSWMRMNYSLAGTEPWAWHLSTVLAHVLATVLVFKLAMRLLQNRWQALIAGLIFAVHPVHVESVAWVCGAADPLLAVFFLGSLLCYLNWRDHRSPAWMAASLVLGLLAMLAKEPGVALPAVVFAYAWIFAEVPDGAPGADRRLRAAVASAAPFLLVFAAYFVLRHIALRTASPVAASNATALLTVPGLLLFYLRIAAWPVGLTVFYDRSFVGHATFGGVWLPLLVLALLAAVFLLFAARSRQRRVELFSLALALLTLFPVLWVRWFPSDDFVHDRYLYLPLAGIAMLFATIIVHLGGRPMPGWVAPVRQIVVVCAVVVVLLGETLWLQRSWKDDFALWSHCYRTAPHNQRVLNNLASAMGERGDYQNAIRLFLEILQRNPNDERALGNLGYTFYRMGDLQKAEQTLGRAVQLDPSDAHSLLYLGVAHFKLGLLAPAEEELKQAIALSPETRGAHLALSFVLERQGDVEGAIRETANELSRNPGQGALEQRLNQLRAAHP